MNKEKLIAEVERLTLGYNVMMNKLFEFDENIIVLEKRIKDIEYYAKDEVFNAEDETGRPLYSNEAKRDIALRNNLMQKQEFVNLRNDLEKLRSSKNKVISDIEIIRMNMRAFEVMAKLL